jgi:CubicO group peptidase (beta-lactamase class C family)
MKALSIVVFVFFALCSSCQQANEAFTYPDSSWEKLDQLHLSDWDSLKLADLRKFVIDSAQTTGLIIIYRGKILFEYGDVVELSYLASARKSILSMIYGPFVKNGKINLSKTLSQLGFEDNGGLLPIEKQATIKDLLTARSGIYHAASNPGDETAIAPQRGTKQPGTFFLYNNWDFNAAGAVFEKETGLKIFDAVDSILARPLQMQDWKKTEQKMLGDSARSRYLAYHLWFSTRDMARLGYLMLRNGRWKKQQILPQDWIKRSTSVVTSYSESAQFRKSPPPKFGYAYLWWVWDKPFDTGGYEGAYTAWGAFGQYITVLPKLDVVIAHKTKSAYQRQTPITTYQKILDLIVAAKK